MNPWILSLFIITTIVSPWGGLGIITGLSIIYLFDKSSQDGIMRKCTTWGWRFFD